MSTAEIVPFLDPVFTDALIHSGGKVRELGFVDDDDPEIDVGEVSESTFGDYIGSIADDLDVGAMDPLAQARALKRMRAVSLFAQGNPKVARMLGPMTRVLESTRNVLSRASASAANYRVTQTMEQLSGPNHKTNIHIEALATASATGLITVTAPYSGQPFRLVGINTEARSVATAAVAATEVIAVGFSSFSLNGIQRVDNSNVAIASGSVGTAKWDLADFSARNPTHPQRKVYPWGTGPTTWLSPDAKIQFAIRNDSGSTVNASIALLWQATPCNPRDASIMSEGIVPRSEHLDLFRGLTRFRPYRFKS
jgi:hypothetical protein